jgi:hypothetical protein
VGIAMLAIAGGMIRLRVQASQIWPTAEKKRAEGNALLAG